MANRAPKARARVGYARIPRGTKPSIAFRTRTTRESLNRIMRNLNKILGEMEGATPGALKYGLKPVYEESQRLVPVDTGALKSSGYLEARKTPSGVVAEVGYAKGGKPYYAVFVHENLEAYHKPPTQAKFLQAALEKNMDRIPRRVAYYIRNKLKRGRGE